MKLSKYFVYFFVIAYCSYSYATPKEKISNLACPYILPAKKDFSANWIPVGKISDESMRIRSVGIIYTKSSDIPNRNFSEDIIDEWEELKDRSQAVAGYDENHEDVMLKCVYAKSAKEDSDHNVNNVVLLIPLPSKKNRTCLLVRRNVSPEFEASCKIK